MPRLSSSHEVEAMVLEVCSRNFSQITSSSNASRSQLGFEDGRYFRKTRERKNRVKECRKDLTNT